MCLKMSSEMVAILSRGDELMDRWGGGSGGLMDKYINGVKMDDLNIC